MRLRQIIEPVGLLKIPDKILEVEISSICTDSRKVTPGALFVALPGHKAHGFQFIEDAVRRGASLVVYESSLGAGPGVDRVASAAVADPFAFLTTALKNFYLRPAKPVVLTGITGTNGKTTITYLLESLLSSAGKRCGVIGTVNYRFAGQTFKAGNTTPGLVDNYVLVSQMAAADVSHCVMEVSSHALDQRRVEGLEFRYAVFTNLTSDHMDYHHDRESYFLAKAKLFTSLNKNSCAVINLDDPLGGRLKGMSLAPVVTYGIESAADIVARDIQMDFEQTRFSIEGLGQPLSIRTRLIGRHNIYNILAAVAVGYKEHIPLDVIAQGVERLTNVPGRLERVATGQDFHVFVDYAHTQDALHNVLSSLRQVSASRIIVVFGCGGDRDKGKRPQMAAVVEELADDVIVTTDNPRSEDPASIIKDICEGFHADRYQVVLDRKEAIHRALQMARPTDVVLIAGKGHEDYQIFKDKTIPFDEKDVIRQYCMTVRQ